MKVEYKIYSFNNEMKLWLEDEKTVNKYKASQIIIEFYRKNPYAKKLEGGLICSDYRIDQQRPQRNVQSEQYLKLVSMTELEERYVDATINSLEKNIDYPTVWDDGVNRHYEQTIYCPKCGKRRKVLTSETHCEFCGFEFSKALKCPKCNSLNLKGSDECKKCGYEFRKESFINNDEFNVKKDKDNSVVKCPKCGGIKSRYFDTCQECGFDYKDKKECPVCHEWVDEKDKYCLYCGQMLNVLIKCKHCGKKIFDKNKFCTNCGQKL